MADFPKPGIQFKDITTLLVRPELNERVISEFSEEVGRLEPDAIIGIESRGFLFGLALANRLHLPFIPIRKHGKLPYKVISETYDLEYGTARIEMHTDAFTENSKLYIHDDVLATGGTADAAAELVKKLNGQVVGFGFLAEFSSLGGREKISSHCNEIYSVVKY